MNTTDKRNAASIAAVIGLLALFAILSRSAALTKSATRDETLHAAAGWTYVHAHDCAREPGATAADEARVGVLHDPLDLAYSTKTMAWRAILANLRFQWTGRCRRSTARPRSEATPSSSARASRCSLFGVGLGAAHRAVGVADRRPDRGDRRDHSFRAVPRFHRPFVARDERRRARVLLARGGLHRVAARRADHARAYRAARARCRRARSS